MPLDFRRGRAIVPTQEARTLPNMRRLKLLATPPAGLMILVLATVLMWLLNYVITTIWTLSGKAMPHQWALAERRLVMTFVGMLISAGVYVVLRAGSRWPVLWQALLSVAAVLAAILLHTVIHVYVFYHFGAPWGPSESPYWMDMLSVSTMVSWVFIACVGAYFAISYGEQLRERDARLIQLEALAVDAQNRMLRYQINPHFLFNALNALSTQVMQGRTQAAEAMILSISQFLRRSLMTDIATKVTLGEELTAERQYLSIEQVRFGERLTIVQDVSDDAAAALIPSFILQPLVENAVKHGVAETSAPVTLCLQAEAVGDRLHIRVADDGGGQPAKASGGNLGVGLANVRRRLEVLYGANAQVAWGGREGGGFEVRLDLPVEYA